MSIKVLDCTLRDGGFLTGMVKDPECSLYNSVEYIEEMLPPQRRHAMYVAMIAIGEKELHPSGLIMHDFSNAQVLGKIQSRRTLILDSSVYGMGRGAGNLPTELITQYINRNIASRYDVTMVMDVYDEFISKIRREHEWGYTLPYHIAASYVCHPNYAQYLLKQRTLTTKEIEQIIRQIPGKYRILYNQKLVEELYTRYQNGELL